MKVYMNECCGCAAPNYPCVGSACSLMRVAHIVCDNCGEEEDKMYEYDENHYCLDCLMAKLIEDKIIEVVKE